MYTFTNITTLKSYETEKKKITFQSVPNTAVGFDSCRKYIVWNGYKYFISANTEKDYFLLYGDISCPSDRMFSVNFSVDGDKITIDRASNNGRTEKANRYLKKYASILCMVHSCIKYDKIIKYKPYRVARSIPTGKSSNATVL